MVLSVVGYGTNVDVRSPGVEKRRMGSSVNVCCEGCGQSRRRRNGSATSGRAHASDSWRARRGAWLGVEWAWYGMRDMAGGVCAQDMAMPLERRTAWQSCTQSQMSGPGDGD